VLLKAWAINDRYVLLVFDLRQARARGILSEQKLYFGLMRRDFVKDRMLRSLLVLKAGAGTRICLLETLMVPRFLRSPRFAFSTLGPLFVFTAVSHKGFIIFLPGCGSIRRHSGIKSLQNRYLRVVLNDLILQNALISIADQTSCHLI